MFKKVNKLSSLEIKNFFLNKETSFDFNIKRSTLFDIKVLSGKGVESLKVGVVVSSKITKSAIRRNKIKRQIYSVLSSFIKEKKIKAMILIFPKREVLNIKFLDLKKELYNVLHIL